MPEGKNLKRILGFFLNEQTAENWRNWEKNSIF
jgi:hypothetical protein